MKNLILLLAAVVVTIASIIIATSIYSHPFLSEKQYTIIVSALNQSLLEPLFKLSENKILKPSRASEEPDSSFSPTGTSFPWGQKPLTVTEMSQPRRIQKVFEAIEQAEGAGARVRRSVGTPKLRNLSPFLMCDHFTISPGAGFPDHPHRGQETITYLLQGAVDHEDFTGSRGTITSGSLQFMTAGKGIVHAEMPSPDHPVSSGIQLWVDLPRHLKYCDPRYRDLDAGEIPLAHSEDGKVEVKVISGQSYGVDSVKDLAYSPVWLLDIIVRPGGQVAQPLPQGWNSFLYTIEGGATTFAPGTSSERVVGKYNVLVWEKEGDLITAKVDEGANEPSRFILVAGQPMDHPVVQYGPFVVSSREEVIQAQIDYQTNSNGFEKAANWQSNIGQRMMW